MRYLFYSLLLTLTPLPLCAEGTPPASTLILKDRFAHATSGDYIVTAQEKNYSLLFIRDLDKKTLILEEITVPEEQINLSTQNWQQWLSDKAPGHTAWTLYEIDLNTGTLIESFSFSQNGWLFLDETQLLITRLLTLPLTHVKSEERRKIGPPPQSGEVDQRALWNPPLILGGKKIPKPQFDVWKTKWPEEQSPLSGCRLELYFAKSDALFAFPRWIDIQSPHYSFKLRTIDSGKDLHSPYSGPMPHRPPKFLGPALKTADGLRLHLNAPIYQNSFTLYAIDLGGTQSPLIIPHRVSREGTTQKVSLEIARNEIARLLLPEHRYQWALVPDEDRSLYAESHDVFLNTVN